MGAVTVTLNIPIGRLKRDIIELAFDDAGLAGYEFDRTPEEQSMALRKLNAMMLEHPWSLLTYNQPDYGAGLVEEPSGLPDKAVNTVAQYLARRIVPGMGGTLSQDALATLARSLMIMQAETATVPVMGLPARTVAGSGHRPQYYRYPFIGRR